jgi:hypothetical protein
MKKTLCKLIAIQFLAAGAAFAECTKESAPALPDGASADESQMISAQGAVKSYMAATNAYLECVDSSLKKASTKTEKVKLHVAYNDTVDEMNELASKFNKTLRAYKKSQA